MPNGYFYISYVFTIAQLLALIVFVSVFSVRVNLRGLRENLKHKIQILESSRFTRNQPKFNLLNCQDNFQDQNGFHKNQNEFHQDQNGFHQDQNTTILNTTEPDSNGHKYQYPLSTRV